MSLLVHVRYDLGLVGEEDFRVVVEYYLDGPIAQAEEDGMLRSDPLFEINHGRRLIVNPRGNDLDRCLIGIGVRATIAVGSILLPVFLVGLLLLLNEIISKVLQNYRRDLNKEIPIQPWVFERELLLGKHDNVRRHRRATHHD